MSSVPSSLTMFDLAINPRCLCRPLPPHHACRASRATRHRHPARTGKAHAHAHATPCRRAACSPVGRQAQRLQSVFSKSRCDKVNARASSITAGPTSALFAPPPPPMPPEPGIPPFQAFPPCRPSCPSARTGHTGLHAHAAGTGHSTHHAHRCSTGSVHAKTAHAAACSVGCALRDVGMGGGLDGDVIENFLLVFERDPPLGNQRARSPQRPSS